MGSEIWPRRENGKIRQMYPFRNIILFANLAKKLSPLKDM